MNTSRNPDRAELRALLAEALNAGSMLNNMLAIKMPESAAEVEKNLGSMSDMTVDERIAAGNAIIGQLREITFQVNPDMAIDLVEGELNTDKASCNSAQIVIDKAKRRQP